MERQNKKEREEFQKVTSAKYRALKEEHSKTVNELNYNVEERRRLQEMVYAQQQEINLLIKGDSGFGQLKKVIADFHKSFDAMEAGISGQAAGAAYIRSIMEHIEEIINNRDTTRTVKIKKKKRGGRDDSGESNTPSSFVVTKYLG